jgi:hypothetical protein
MRSDFANHYSFLDRLSAELEILKLRFRDSQKVGKSAAVAIDVANLISELYSVDEFTQLIFSLNIDPDNIEAGTMAVRSHYLVDYCKRHGTLAALIEQCKKDRPMANWP